MLFSELLAGAGVKVSRLKGDVEIAQVAADSRSCRSGCCFVAVSGSSQDGHKYIPAALAAGAAAIVCQDAQACGNAPVTAVVEDSRLAVGLLAQALRGWPAKKLTTLAVTGTNGKSTTACLVRDILLACGHRPALLGTISYDTGGRSIAANQTTPDPIALADMMAEMLASGRTHLVMEASSHALDQDRLAGLQFRGAAFTNLTGDHLDYHGTMDDYLLAKQRLFEQLSADAFAVINQDDPAGAQLATATRANVIFYGLSPAADLRAKIASIDARGTAFEMTYAPANRAPESAMVQTPLIGRHNVFNCLAAAGLCVSVGIDLPRIAAALANVKTVPGRLERVQVEGDFQVFVDYAHTDDALVNVLGALRPVTKGRLILVFGCGGDRDRTKRPRMAKVAQELADRMIVTSDNPRSEDPMAIIDQIVAGFGENAGTKAHIEPDRRKAIELAIGEARGGDIVLIAGKGHEKYQIIGQQRNHFDDVEVAQEVMMRRGGR